MEEKINIAEILKDKPKGTKLYDLLYNVDVELDKISTTDTETVVWCTNETDNNTTCRRSYSEFGTVRGCHDGLQILLPSKEMRDWSKFAWKKGDILVGCAKKIIFDKFTDDTYSYFEGKYCLEQDPYSDYETYRSEDKGLLTKYFHIPERCIAQSYIKNIEERLGGKLNRETLEIEKQQEFKDGDVVFVRLKSFCFIEIFNYFKDDYLYDHASLSTKLQMIDICGIYPISKDEIVEIRLATDLEKKQLFEALAKKGKAWNDEKKAIVDLKPKWNPKPFDRVVTRVDDDAVWTANIFSHIDSYGEYNTIGCVGGYPYCLPYNEETAKLIGTSDEWKGGE